MSYVRDQHENELEMHTANQDPNHSVQPRFDQYKMLSPAANQFQRSRTSTTTNVKRLELLKYYIRKLIEMRHQKVVWTKFFQYDMQ